jgi:adenylosuccinate synthase
MCWHHQRLLRVGGGPFPTELEWERGHTAGTWPPSVPKRRDAAAVVAGSMRLCSSAGPGGLTGLCITKLDVLDGLTELALPATNSMAKPSTSCLGADESPCADLRNAAGLTILRASRYDDLPENARRYLTRIEETTGVPIHGLTSPDAITPSCSTIRTTPDVNAQSCRRSEPSAQPPC